MTDLDFGDWPIGEEAATPMTEQTPFSFSFDLSGHQYAALAFDEFGTDQVLLHAFVPNARLSQTMDRSDLRQLIAGAQAALKHLERVQWLRTARENEERSNDLPERV